LVSFSLVIFPALFGIWVRHKSAKHAKYGERVGSIGGASMVLGAAISGFVANGETLADRDLLPATTLVSVLIVGPMGMLCSFLIAYFFPIGPRMATQDIVTISLETGVQNTVLALAIVNISFSDVLSPFELFQAQFFPICWGLFVLLEGSLLVLGYRLYLRKTKKEPAEIVLAETEGGLGETQNDKS
jgi:predicted Na+-dependent transporter